MRKSSHNEICLSCRNYSKLILLPMSCKHPICTNCFCAVHLTDIDSLPPKSTRIYCCDICSCETIYTRKMNFKIQEMISNPDRDASLADQFVIKRNKRSFIEDLEDKMSSPPTVKKGGQEEEETEETERPTNQGVQNLNLETILSEEKAISSKCNTRRTLWESTNTRDIKQEVNLEITKIQKRKNPKNILFKNLEFCKNIERCTMVKFEPLKHKRVQRNPRKHKITYLREQNDQNSKIDFFQDIQQSIQDITYFSFIKEDPIKPTDSLPCPSKTLKFQLSSGPKIFKKSQKKSKSNILEKEEEEPFHQPENTYQDQDTFMTIQFRASYNDSTKRSSSPLQERISASKSILKNSGKKTVNFSAEKTKLGFAGKRLYRTFHAADAGKAHNSREKLDFDLSQSFTESNKNPLENLRNSQRKKSNLSDLKRQLMTTENRGLAGHFRSKTYNDIKLTPRELKKSILMDDKFSSKIPLLPLPPSQKIGAYNKKNQRQLRNISVAAESVESYNAGSGYFASGTSDRERITRRNNSGKKSCDFGLLKEENNEYMKISGAFQRSFSRMSAKREESDGDSGCGLGKLHRSLYKPADHFNSSKLLLKKVMVYKGLERDYNN